MAGLEEVVSRDHERLEAKETQRRSEADKERKAREKKAASRSEVALLFSVVVFPLFFVTCVFFSLQGMCNP